MWSSLCTAKKRHISCHKLAATSFVTFCLAWLLYDKALNAHKACLCVSKKISFDQTGHWSKMCMMSFQRPKLRTGNFLWTALCSYTMSLLVSHLSCGNRIRPQWGFSFAGEVSYEEMFQEKYVSVCVCVCAFKREYTLWGWHYCHNKEGGKYLYGLLYGPFQLYTIISNVLPCATTISLLHILWQPKSRGPKGLQQNSISLRHVCIYIWEILWIWKCKLLIIAGRAVCPSQRLWCTIGPWQPSSY